MFAQRTLHDVAFLPIRGAQGRRDSRDHSSADSFIHDALIENPRGEIGRLLRGLEPIDERWHAEIEQLDIAVDEVPEVTDCDPATVTWGSDVVEDGKVPLARLVPRVGTRWQGRGEAFKDAPKRLRCTLLALWEEGYAEPWLVLTDLSAKAARACWYGLRVWIEQGFKVTKRAGWQWHRTRMTHPDRAARLWLAIAVATLWLVSVGGEADADDAPVPLPDLVLLYPPRGRHRHATRLRLVGVFRRGWTLLLVALLHHAPLPLPAAFLPEPWPALPPPRPTRDALALARSPSAA